MLGKLAQDRAISLSDGGRRGGDAVRVKIAVCCSFVLRFRARVAVVVAGFLTISAMVGVTIEVAGVFPGPTSCDGRLVSSSPHGTAHRVAQGGEHGSDQGSLRAPGSGSQCQTAPKALYPGTWGGLV
jgi:hypothetical protein